MRPTASRRLSLVRTLIALALAGACSAAQSPRDFVLGDDACGFCRMAITDARFGGEVRTAAGRLLTFDAVECLAGYVAEHRGDSLSDIWVADYTTGKFTRASEAWFVLGGTVESPMGRELSSFAPSITREALRDRYRGEVLSWTQVLARQLTIPAVASTAPREPDTTPSTGSDSASERDIVVTAIAGATPLLDAVRRAAPGATIRVRPGVYREPTVRIDRPLALVGDSGAILDGGGTHTIVEIAADDVTVRGLTLRNTGEDQTVERAGISVQDARDCLVAENRFEMTFFAVHLARANGCIVRDNVMRGPGRVQTASGNGVHVWSSDSVQILHNDVLGHRDGIYFEFVKHSRVIGNHTERSARYGMHFMFSDDCLYEDNTFRHNGNGVAVMYSHRVAMLRNRFEHNWGGAAYGLLLKDINDSRIEGNQFVANSVGLYLEGANRNQITANTFDGNGWALKTLANAEGNRYEGNLFERNAFDVGTNSRGNVSRFDRNYWDRYRGYDLDRDGVGDVPFAPVRLFALVVEQSPPTLILLHSLLVDLLDLAERVLPSLTPETLRDEHPLMQRPSSLATNG